MNQLIDLCSFVLLLGGCFFILTGAIGLVRLPDFFTRLHAAGLTDTLGCFLIMSGLILQAGISLVSIKLLLIVFFIFFTSPAASHALAKAAIHGGLKPKTEFNDEKE